MEQLQRLAAVIAETYARDFKRKTGSDVIEAYGIRKNMGAVALAGGLIDNFIHYAKGRHGAAFDLHAYSEMTRLISFNGTEPALTELGVTLIETLIDNAMKRQSKIIKH